MPNIHPKKELLFHFSLGGKNLIIFDTSCESTTVKPLEMDFLSFFLYIYYIYIHIIYIYIYFYVYSLHAVLYIIARLLHHKGEIALQM